MAQAHSIENPPRVVLELYSTAALVQHDGGRDKGLRKRMLALGYYQRRALVRNTEEGGAVSSDRLVPSYTLTRNLPMSDQSPMTFLTAPRNKVA
jgi:hypothetical protein